MLLRNVTFCKSAKETHTGSFHKVPMPNSLCFPEKITQHQVCARSFGSRLLLEFDNAPEHFQQAFSQATSSKGPAKPQQLPPPDNEVRKYHKTRASTLMALVVNNMPLKEQSCNDLIVSLANIDDTENLEKQIEQATQKGFQITEEAYKAIMKHYFAKREYSKAVDTFYKAKARQIPSGALYGLAIFAYSQLRDLPSCMKLWEEMRRFLIKPTLGACNSMIKAHCDDGNINAAFNVYKELLSRNLKPNLETFMYLANTRGLEEPPKDFITKEMKKFGIKPKPGASEYFDYLIGMRRFDLLDELFEIERSSGHVNLTMLNKMISSYLSQGRIQKALDCLTDMKSKGLVPDVQTYIPFIQYFASRGEFDQAKFILETMKKEGVKPNEAAYHCLIDPLSKRVSSAQSVLALVEDMKAQGVTPDGRIYTSLITYYGRHGQAKAAIEMYNVMLAHNGSPTQLTFLSIMSTFMKRGDIPNALFFLKEMTDRFKMIPSAAVADTILVHFISVLDRENTWTYYTQFKSKGTLPSSTTFNMMIKLYSAVNDTNKVSELDTDMRSVPWNKKKM